MMTSALSSGQREYTLDLPPGFIEIPLGELSSDVIERAATQAATAFGLSQGDQHTRNLAFALSSAVAGELANDISYLAIGFFRSHDGARPIMVAITCLSRPSQHEEVQAAISGLLEVHRDQGQESVWPIQLSSGPAVAVVTEEFNELTIDGQQDAIPLIQRAVTAWTPDPDGTTLAVVSVSSNNWQDWDSVCELALDLFDTLEWAP